MVFIEAQNPDIAPFYVGKTPITQALFSEIMEYNQSSFKGDNLPAERVSWYEALVFCNLLSVAHGLEPVYIYHRRQNRTDPPTKDVYEWVAGWGGIPNNRVATWNMIEMDTEADGYRLLTSLEWDYLYNSLNSDIFENLEEYAWVYTNSDNTTHAVGQKRVDSNGLYDFLGNVKEWQYDEQGHISERYFRYSSEAQEAFYNSLGYKKFVFREFMYVMDQRGYTPVIRNSLIGLRVARNSAF